MRNQVLMIGDSLECPGGISSVARTYKQSGLLQSLNATYLSNYDGPGLLRQVTVMLRVIARIIAMRRDAAIIHIHSAARGGFWRALVLLELGRLLGMRCILHIHSGEFLDFFDNECGKLKRMLVRRAFRRASRIICLTSGWKAKLAAIDPHARFFVLPNPVQLPEEHPSNAGGEVRPVLLYLGRLSEKKGIFDLLSAIAMLKRDFPTVSLIVAGAGDDDEAARAYVKKAHIDDVVTFVGWVSGDSKEALLRRATIIVAPSHFEAFGVSIVEGMAYGKPVVACRVGGIPEVMIEGRHGVLVVPGQPAELARAIATLLSNPTSLCTMGSAAREHVRQHFSTNSVLSSLTSCYKEVQA